MVDVRITPAGLWVALMLTYLLGDVLRLFAGDFVAGEMDGQPVTQPMWLLAAGVMLIPIVMIVLSVTVNYPAIRWISIVGRGFPGALQPRRTALRRVVRQFLDRCELGVQRTDRLVRMDVASCRVARSVKHSEPATGPGTPVARIA